MAVKIRKIKEGQKRTCNSCSSKENIFEIYVGKNGQGSVSALCDGCMHTLLQKLIIMGSKYNEVL